MQIQNPHRTEAEVLHRLSTLSEFDQCGFSARAGLTGRGVTVLKGRGSFGSWRVLAGTLTWTHAQASGASYVAQSVDDAVRYTMLLILRSLQSQRIATLAAMA